MIASIKRRFPGYLFSAGHPWKVEMAFSIERDIRLVGIQAQILKHARGGRYEALCHAPAINLQRQPAGSRRRAFCAKRI
jgi:hypothetical protein